MAGLKHYFLQVLIACSQLLCTLIGGWADETMSSYAWRLEQKGRLWGRIWRPTIDWLFRVIAKHNDHCYESYLSERRRSQIAPELRSALSSEASII